MSDQDLSAEELQQFFEHAGDAVVVGGQALAIWAQWFSLPLPKEDTLTRDVDFLGDAEAAEHLAEALGAECKIPSIDDHTPNSALVVVRRPDGTTLHIDYLYNLAGLNEATVRRRACELKLPSGTQIKVMHPYDCLESRIKNLILLPAKNNASGATQAQLAIAVVREHLKSLLRENNGDREACNFAEKLADLALSEHGIRVWLKHGIDVLDAIPAESFPDKFRNIRFPQIVEAVDKKRQRRLRQTKQARRPWPDPRP